jgi:hypothetical protein
MARTKDLFVPLRVISSIVPRFLAVGAFPAKHARLRSPEIREDLRELAAGSFKVLFPPLNQLSRHYLIEVN